MITDWGILGASEIPRWMIGLLSSNVERQEQSFRKLSRYLREHALALNVSTREFNTVLETDVPVLITPFLLEMLDNSYNANLVYVSRLLMAVVSYVREPSLRGLKLERAKKIVNLISEKHNILLDLLGHGDHNVRVEIILLLCNLPYKEEAVATILLQNLQSGQIYQDIEVITSFECLYEIVQNKSLDISSIKPDFVMLLMQVLDNKDTSVSVREVAICYIFSLQGRQASSAVINGFKEMLKKTQSNDRPHIISYSHIWIPSLHALDIRKATPLLFEVLEHQNDTYIAFYMSAVLMMMHFSSEVIYFLHLSLNEVNINYANLSITFEQNHEISFGMKGDTLLLPQKDVLNKLLDKDLLWNYQTNLFSLFGLPSERSQLKILLGK